MAIYNQINGVLEFEVTNNFKSYLENIAINDNWDKICNKFYYPGDPTWAQIHTIYTISSPDNTNFIIDNNTYFKVQNDTKTINIGQKNDYFNYTTWDSEINIDMIPAKLKYNYAGSNAYRDYIYDKLFTQGDPWKYPDQAMYYSPGSGITNSTIVLHNISRYYLDGTNIGFQGYNNMIDIYNDSGYAIAPSTSIRLLYKLQYNSAFPINTSPKFKIVETNILCNCNNGTPIWAINHNVIQELNGTINSCGT